MQLYKDNRDNLGSFHSLWLAKAKSLPNNDFDEQLYTKIEFTQNTGQWNKPLRNSVNGSYYEHSIQFTVPKYRPEVESFLLLNIDVPLIAYIKLHNGDFVRIGTKESPFLLASDFTSGTGAMGFNSYAFSGRATEVLKRNFGVTLPTLPTQNDVPAILQAGKVVLSVRRVNQDYAGSCFTLRRDSDNATQNFGFLANGELDIAAITTFKGAANLFVRTWYDQKATGANSFFNINNATQPQLLLDGNNGRAEVRFAFNNYLECDNTLYAGTQSRTLFSAMHFTATGLCRTWFRFGRTLPYIALTLGDYGSPSIIAYTDDTTEVSAATAAVTINAMNVVTNTYRGAGNTIKLWIGNSEQTMPTTVTQASPATDGAIIIEKGSDGIVQEMIVVDGVLSDTDRLACQNNIKTFFNL